MKTLQIKLTGRFGNQLGQYAFARSYAEAYGLAFECGPWVGDRVFDLGEKKIEQTYPVLPFDKVPDPNNIPEKFRLDGYYQHANAYAYMRLYKVRKWFKFKPEFEVSTGRYTGGIRFHIACHARMGDYLSAHPELFACVKHAAFVAAVEARGWRQNDIVWLEEEEPQPLPNGYPPELNYLVDFQVIQNAPVIFRSNSTFSLWAAFLSKTAYAAGEVYAPEVGNNVGLCEVPFVKGNYPALIDRKNFSWDFTHTEARIAD